MLTTGVRKTENFHILLWLIKDLCWVSLSKTLGMIMVIPTIGLAFYITYLSRSERSELVHNLAVCFWILANSVWMTGEFYTEDSMRPYATILFILGLAMLARFYGEIIFKRLLRRK